VSDQIILLVSALIADAHGRVLLTAHAPTYKLHLPDGDVRFGETLRDALVRSVREDLAVVIVPDARPFLVTESFGIGGGKHFLTFHFRAKLGGAVARNYHHIAPATAAEDLGGVLDNNFALEAD
jgi:ADP-ribose pyrophosphatase YjhB (NUDIX family)